MLMGHVKSNVQYSFSKSKNRIGAFGVKGWVSNK
jgi:ribosomal protein S3